jgi:hypothetical protein
MAAVLKSGSRECGPYFYSARDTTWNLMGNSGVRTWGVTITFSTAFASTPSVNPYIMGFHMIDGTAHKLSVGVTGVSTTGFTLQINTWDECQVAGVLVGWIAYIN